MFGTRLNRLLFGELLRIFAITLAGLSGLFLIGLVVQQANQLGLSMGQTLAAIPLLIPSTLPFTMPATTLFAASVAYGRLSHDNEAVAIKAAGIDLLTVLRPAALLGGLTAVATFTLCHTVIPNSQIMLQKQVLKNPDDVIYNLLKRDRSFRSPQSPYSIYVRDVQGKRLLDVVLKRRKKILPGQDLNAAGYDFVARAREASLRVDVDRGLLLVKLSGWGAVGDGANLYTDDNPEVEIPLPPMFNVAEAKARISATTWDSLPARAAEHQGIIDHLSAEWSEKLERYKARNQLAAAAQEEPVYAALIKEAKRQRTNSIVEYHFRPALAVGCLCFALIGCPVGLRVSRADYLSVFMVCFLPAVFCYYPLLLAGTNLAKDGKVPVLVGVWLANSVAIAASVTLTKLLIRR
jgi:lipopolysaccharide export system permease protein